MCVWADVLVFRSRDELARNREYDGDDDYYCCCCFGCCGGFVSTTPSPLLLPSLLLLVLRDATGMMGRVAATTRSIPEECRRLRRMRERGGSRHSCDNEREHHRREKFLSWLRWDACAGLAGWLGGAGSHGRECVARFRLISATSRDFFSLFSWLGSPWLVF